jgi:hypothetical protein
MKIEKIKVNSSSLLRRAYASELHWCSRFSPIVSGPQCSVYDFLLCLLTYSLWAWDCLDSALSAAWVRCPMVS